MTEFQDREIKLRSFINVLFIWGVAYRIMQKLMGKTKSKVVVEDMKKGETVELDNGVIVKREK